MKSRFFKIGKYSCFFLLFLLSYLFLPLVAADETWSYGFSYNIATGLVPYRDFNMIVPPFFAFFFALFLLFYQGIVMFHVGQALLMTFICYLLEKLVKEKSLLLILILLILAPMIYNLPTYNILCLAFALLLVYLEREEKSDFLIGLVLAFCLLTKQSIGGVLFFVGLFLVRKSPLRLGRRFCGFLIPVVMTSFYLVITKSFFPFIDQCILGMFDFSKNGTSSFPMMIFIIGILVGFICYFNRKQYEQYWLYALAFYSVCFPLFDLTHFLIGLFCLFLIIVAHQPYRSSFYVNLALSLFILFIPLVNCFSLLYYGNVYPNDIKNYEYRYLNREEYHNLSVLSRYRKTHSDYELIILSSSAYIFKLSNDLKITKLDLINRGNWGMHGTEKIIKEIRGKDLEQTLFFVNEAELDYDNQIDKDVLTYVIDRGKRVDQVLYFDVYQLN